MPFELHIVHYNIRTIEPVLEQFPIRFLYQFANSARLRGLFLRVFNYLLRLRKVRVVDYRRLPLRVLPLMRHRALIWNKLLSAIALSAFRSAFLRRVLRRRVLLCLRQHLPRRLVRRARFGFQRCALFHHALHGLLPHLCHRALLRV